MNAPLNADWLKEKEIDFIVYPSLTAPVIWLAVQQKNLDHTCEQYGLMVWQILNNQVQKLFFFQFLYIFCIFYTRVTIRESHLLPKDAVRWKWSEKRLEITKKWV